MRKRNSNNTKKSSKRSSNTSTKSLDNMKYEIASEFGVNLGPDATSRANGTVGGEITKRLVDQGKKKS